MSSSIPLSTRDSAIVQGRQWTVPFSSSSFRVGSLLLVAVWLWYAGPLLWGTGDLFLIDTAVLDLPNRIHCANQIRNGYLPFWTDRIANGWSPLAENQTGIFYPFFLLYVFSPTPQMHDIFMAVHFLFAGVFAYLYLSRHFTPLAALVGAVSYMAAPVLQRTHTVPGTMQIACWLPLCLLCIDLRLESGSNRALYGLALINTLMTFAGFPQLALTVFTLEVIYYLAMGGWRLPSRWIKDGAIVFLLAGLLSAPQNVPTYLFFKESSRSEAFSWEYFRSTATPIALLIGGGVPPCVLNSEYSFSFDTRWVPVVALALFLLGSLVLVWKQPFLRFWLVVGILGVLLATDTPLLRVLYNLPIYNLFRWHSVYLLFTTMGVSVLVAGVLEAVLHRTRHQGIQLIITTVSVAALSFHHMGFYLSDQPVYGQIDPAITQLQTTKAHFRLWPMTEAHQRAVEKGHFSSDTLLATARTSCANYNLMQDIPSGRLIHQFQTVVTREFYEYYHPNRMSFREDLPTLIRGAANSHVSSMVKLPDSHARNLDPIKEGPDVWLYEVQNPLPRAWMVYQTESIPDSQERLARLSSIEFDAGQSAVTEREFPAFNSPTIPPEVRWKLPRPDAIQLDVDTQTPGLLVLSDTWSPYFHATIDGRSTPIERVNHTFRGISIPSGKHSVEMYYWSASFPLSGIVASIAAIVLTFQLLAGEHLLLAIPRLLLSAVFGAIALFCFVDVVRGPTAPRTSIAERSGSNFVDHKGDAATAHGPAILPRLVVHSIELDEKTDKSKSDFDLTIDSENDDTFKIEVRTTTGELVIAETKAYPKGISHFQFSLPRGSDDKKCILSVQSHQPIRSISLSENRAGTEYAYASSDWCVESTFALSSGVEGGKWDLRVRAESPTNQTLAIDVAEVSGTPPFYHHLIHLTEGTRNYDVPFSGPSGECLVTVRGRGTWPFRIEEIGWRPSRESRTKINLPRLDVQLNGRATIADKGDNTFEVDVTQIGSNEPWSVILVKNSVKVKSNECLLATFWAKAESSHAMRLVLAKESSPAQLVAPEQHLSLTPEWKKYQIPFVSTDSEVAQLQIQLGNGIGKYCFRDLNVKPNSLRILTEGDRKAQFEQSNDPEIVGVRTGSEGNTNSSNVVAVEFDGGIIRSGVSYQLGVRARSEAIQALTVELIVEDQGESHAEYHREVALTKDWIDIHAEVLANHSAMKSTIRLSWHDKPGVVEFSIPEFKERNGSSKSP